MKQDINKLFRQYDIARENAKATEQAAKELSQKIKDTLGETEEVDTPEYVVTYRYDKDREVTLFDEEAMALKDPKHYKKLLSLRESMEAMQKRYTKTTVIRGARKLYVTRKERE